MPHEESAPVRYMVMMKVVTMNTKKDGFVLLQKNTLGRVLVIALTFIMMVSAFFAGLTDTAYAKDRGQKNKQACEDCNRVVAGEEPKGYDGVAGTEIGGGKHAVYSGGNSYSKAAGKEFDTDPTDFANPLPYGDVYVDANKLNWDNPEGFIIDIQDDRFKWMSVSDTPLTDAKGNESTNDPMGLGKPLKMDEGKDPLQGICYVGPLKSYHDDIKAAASDNGYTNVISPEDKGVPYLYRITYLNAVTLPDGTKGNLVLTMQKVQIETSVTVDSAHPYTPNKGTEKEADYSYTNALVKIQGPNQLSNDTGYQFNDSEGNRVNQQDTQILTEDEAKAIRKAINDKYANLIPDTWEQAKTIRNATGNILDLDIEVTDAAGNAVKGTISYAAHDMDFESAQNIWGRPVDSKFAEAMTIVKGSQSYALVPNYRHDKDGLTRDTGWLPVGPGEDPLERALSIEKDASATGNNADGVRFASPFLLSYRDANGKFDDVIFSNTAVTTFQGDGPAANDRTILNKNGSNPITNIAKKQLYAKLKAKGHSVRNWSSVTAEMAWATLGNYSWKTYRNDADASFDSGFAVLLSSEKSKIQWSGSRVMGSNLNTTLFDPTLFTYIEQTHGTGGGIYFETYDITDNCKVTRREGVSTMGRGVEATVTAVPEDGYRVKTLMVGGEGLSNPTSYDVEQLTFTDGKYVDSANGVTIEKNSDGTYDVTFANMQDPRHVHVDFTADYHFYKVWKGKKDPTSLKMTATPYAFVFRDVYIGNTKYTISNKGNTFTDPSGKAYTLENNAFSVGEAPNIVTYYLEGNSLVTYTVDQTTGKRSKDKEYPIRLDYVQNGKPVKFTVTKADADSSSETHVSTGKEDGYTMWRITYPAEGYTTESGEVWPALPIESNPPAHNINHVERNYWFVTEEAPGWALASYDNSKAEAPGKVDDATKRNEVYKEGTAGDLTAWTQASTKDYTQAEAVIRDAADNDHAYLSVFNSDDDNSYSWGGKIVNVPAVIVNVEKTWKDFSNTYKSRQDVWFHIDAQLDGGDKVLDFLPPQKLSGDASDGEANSDGDANSKFTLTWGDKKAYDMTGYTGTDYSKVKVVGTAADIPRTDKDGNSLYYKQDEKDSHKYLPMLVDGLDAQGKPKYVPDPNGTTYYVNELEDKNGADKNYTFYIRETDAAGNDMNGKAPSLPLYGYNTTVDEKATKDKDQATLDGVNVDSYTGKVTNTLETVEFTVKKVWADGNNKDGKRPTDGKVTYSIKRQVAGESESTTLIKLPVEKSASQGTADITSDYKAGIIEVKTVNGDTVKFSNLPKYDNKGKEITYSVDETAIAGYRTDITGDMSSGYTVTNTQKTEIFVEKEWDDKNDQDGVRPKEVEFELLKGGSATGTKLKLSESTRWKGTFTGLDKYDGDALITYSVKEDDAAQAAGYTASAVSGKGTQSEPFKITNSRDPETIKIKATKAWDDADHNLNDKIGIRFDADFSLYGDGQLVKKLAAGQSNPATVATGDKNSQNMTATWTVDKYRNGRVEIVYNVVEDKDPTSPYSVSVTGDVANGFTVTNKYPPIVEEKIVTRTITYTYLTEDGQTASATVTQAVKLIRTPKLLDLDGGVVEWSKWDYAESDPDKRDMKGVNSPEITGWKARRDVGEWKIDLDNPKDAYENVIYDPLPPTADPDETYGAPGQPQTGKPTFKVTTPNTPNGSDNIIAEYELLDKDGNPARIVEVPEGTYELNDDGTITFTPNDPTFVGDPTPVKVRGIDSNGMSAETKYTPHIVDNTKTVKRTITYEYDDGTPVKDDKGNPLKVEQTVTFTNGIVDPKTGKVTFPEDEKETMPKVDSDPIDGYTADRPSVPDVTVTPKDDDIFEKVVYSPKGITAEPDETWGLPGQPQTGTPTFEMETPTMPDGTPNKVTIKLIDPETGYPCDTVTIPGQGTYKLNDDGTITFTPEEGFVGNPDPIEVEGTDRFGNKARTTYTPHIVNPEDKGTATRTIHYRYLTEDGEEVTGDTTQTVTLTRRAKSVDPKTGIVTEWEDWKPEKFPAVKNPDDKVDGNIWFTDDSAGEETVTEPGEKPDVYIIYEKIPYTVKYLDGDHGKSDGKGDQTGEDYGNDVTGGNGVKPAKGYHFTGKYTYVITDHNGKVIGTGETDDPRSLEVIGNIEFTPIYAPNKYTIKYDANGGSGTMDDQHFTGADDSANSKENEFTRKGYSFMGFKAMLPNGKYLKDENGKDLIFMSTEDFLEYLHEQGDGGEITLVAQWLKEGAKGVKTGDDTTIATWITMLILAITCIIAFAIRRRNQN